MSTITPLQGLVVPQIEEARAERVFASYGGVMDDSEVLRIPQIPTSVDLETYRSQIGKAHESLAAFRSGEGIRSVPAQRDLVDRYRSEAEAVTQGVEQRANAAYKAATLAFYTASGAAALVGTSLTASERQYRTRILDPLRIKFEAASKQAMQTKRTGGRRSLRAVRTGR